MQHSKRTTASLLAIAVLGAGFAAGLSLAAPQSADAKKHRKHAAPKQKDIVETAKADGTFTTLVQALNTAGLVKTLKGKGPFTVFAPSDTAFARMPKEQREGLLADKQKLGDVLKYHVVKGDVSAADLAGKRSVVTLEGESLMLDSKDDGDLLVVDGAMVTKKDIKCGNGTIHVIDMVLIPERGK